jgi:hypothetical protein
VLLALVALAVAGCGGGSSDGDTEAAAARPQAAKQAALDRKERRLREELHMTEVDVRAEGARRRRQAKKHVASAKSDTRPTAGSAAASGSFEQMAAGLSGEVGAVIGPPGSSESASFGNLRSGSAWSTSKVPIALRVLEDAGGPGGLSSSQAEQMRAALTLSDNEAAAALFADLERSHGGIDGASTAVGEVLREGGDATTQVSTEGRGEFSSYGQTEWSLANQQHFISSLAAGCVAGPESSGYVLDLMGEVSSDSWGLGSAGLPAKWKGGWGPGVDGGYLVRQMGILYVGDQEAAVALAALPADGSFETGQAMATAVAQWLAGQAPSYAATPGGC